MLEGQVAELLATYLSRFIENVNAAQLQISLWSGNVVLHNVQLRSDALERITALLHGDLADASSPSPSAGGPDAQGHKQAGATASMRMLLAPFTVVRGVVRQLVIDVPWSSLDSEPVRVQVIGVELVLGPLRARPFNAWEEQEREQAIKQQQLELYERERQQQTREAAEEACSQASSVFSAADSAHRRDDAASAASWFSWLWDFDRISQLALRNVSVTLQDVSLRYEFDYDGLHPACASAFSVFVKQVRLATTDEKFEETFNKNLSGPVCKRMVVSGTVISIHAQRREAPASNGATITTEAAAASTTTTATNLEAPATTLADGLPSGLQSSSAVAGYEAYAARWLHSTALLRLETLELHVKLVPPGCVSVNPIVEEAAVLPTSSTEATIASVGGAEVELCFGAVQVLESMWRSYQQSLSSARYRKRLHLLLRQTRSHAHHDAPTAVESSHAVSATTSSDASPARHGPTARQRWRFAVRCVVDDVRQHRQPASSSAAAVEDRSRREVVEAMVHFGPVRRAYCQYWRRSKGVVWAPALDALEERKLALMERQLTLTQVIFLRCLANAELLMEQDAYQRQQAFIEEARQRTLRARVAGFTAAGGSGGGRSSASALWGWFRGAGGSAQGGTEATHTHDATRAAPLVPDLPLAGRSVCLTDLMEQEWALGQRYVSPHSAPLLQPAVPQNRLSELAAERRLYATLRFLFPILSIRLNPTYWPLHHDSSVPPIPRNTPLTRVRQQLVIQLRTMELFYTTIPDDRPDRASLSFFLGSASMQFDGVLRSMLLQSREQPGEDYVVVKRNAQRTHLGMWVAPQLIVCQPLHEWSWWLAEVAAFGEWSSQLKERFYGAANVAALPSLQLAGAASAEVSLMDTSLAHPSGRLTGSSSVASTPRRHAVPSPMLNVTLQSVDVCVPLFARDIDAADLDVLHHNPSALSSPLMVRSSAGTYGPGSGGGGGGSRGGQVRHGLSSAEVLGGDSEEDRHAMQPLRSNNEGGDVDGAASRVSPTLPPLRKNGLHGVAGEAAIAGVDEENDLANSDYSSLVGSLDSFVSAAPDRYFLNCEACLVLSVSSTRLCTVPPHTRRHRGTGREFYLCIGDQSKAVRVFCQTGCGADRLAGVRQLELLSFVAGEVLVNSKELIVLFNKGIDAVVDPAALAVVNDALLKPAVFAGTGADARTVQRVTADMRRADAGAEQGDLPWRLVSSTVVEVCAGATSESKTTVMQEIPADCARHIVTAVLSAGRSEDAPAEAPSVQGTRSMSSSQSQARRSAAADGLGGRVLTLGMGVARLLVRSEAGTDLAEVVLVAPERVPPATAPYRDSLAALGAQEPRAVELLFNPAGAATRDGVASAGASELVGATAPHGGANGATAVPELLLSVPDITMTTAAGRHLLAVEDVVLLHRSAAPTTPAELELTVEAASAVLDVALVHLIEVMMGVVCALRPLALPPLPERVGDLCRAATAPDTTGSASSALPPLSVRVRRTRLQLPMSPEDVTDTPYVDVAASINDLVCTVKSVASENAAPAVQAHVEFCVPEATQLVDYTGGDPEVRGLVSAMPWTACVSEGAPRPLRCTADVVLPSHAKAPEQPVSPTSCRVAVTGGAVHVYCPFLYFFLAAAWSDQRVVRLGRLATSPLLHRGYTRVRRAAVSPPPARDAGAASALSLEVDISEVDVFLATNAAVPIDVHNMETLAVVHLGRVECGFQQHPSDSAASSPPPTTASSDGAAAVSPSRARTHGHVNVTGVRLLDLVAAGTRDVPLPDVKLHAEMGVLLVPKEDLTGYAYQRGVASDTSLLLGVHSPSPASGASRNNNICLRLSVAHCRSLVNFFAKNAARPAIAARGADAVAGGDAASLMEPGLMAQPTASFAPESEEGRVRSGRDAQVGPGAAVTLLVTIPAASIVVEAEDNRALNWSASACTFPQSTDEDESLPSTAGTPARPAPTRCLCYEFVLRRGAQFYSASGGRWATSPMQNGQLNKLELLVRAPRGDSAADAVPESRGENLLLSVDLVGVALLERRGSHAGSARDSADHRAGDGVLHGEGAAAGVKIAAAVRNAHMRVPHLKWWTQLLATVATIVSAERPLFRPLTGGSSQGFGARPDSAYGDVGSSPNAGASGASAGARGTSRRGYAEDDKAVWPSPHDPHAVPSASRPHEGQMPPQQQQWSGGGWLSGSVEISNTQLSLVAAPQSGPDVAGREFVPMCRIVVPQARITASPLPPSDETRRAFSTPSPTHESAAVDQFVFEVPRCPEVQLWQASDSGAADSFVSVLRQSPSPASAAAAGSSAKGKSGFWKHASVALAAALPVSAPSVAEPCCSLQLLRCAAAAQVGPLRYGRCYSVTEVALYRAGVVQLFLRNVTLDLPAAPLFAFAHALERQWAEAERLVQVDTRFLTTVPRSGDRDEAPPLRTYTSVEAEISNSEVRLCASSLRASPDAAAPATESQRAEWRVAVGSARVTSGVQLCAVHTSDREPATLIDDGAGAGWGVQVWHLVPELVLHSVTLSAATDSEEARWRLPVLRVGLSLPLDRTIVCVRACRDGDATAAGAELPATAEEPAWQRQGLEQQRRSATALYQVEPTAASVCGELDYHVLTRLLVEVAPQEADGAADVAVPSVELPLDTLFTVAAAVARLAALKDSALHTPASGQQLPSSWHRHGSVPTWYEVKLSLCGHAIDLVAGSALSGVLMAAAPLCEGDDTAAALRAVSFSTDGPVTLLVDREELEEGQGGSPTFGSSQGEDSEGRETWTGFEYSSSGGGDHVSGASPAVVRTRTLVRLRTNAMHLHDGAGNLLLRVAVWRQGGMTDALVADYIQAENCVRLNVGRVLACASAVTACSAVHWWRTYEGARRHWARLAGTPAALVPPPRETHAAAAAEDDAAPLNVHEDPPYGLLPRLDVDVRHAELLMAPAARAIARRTHVSYAQGDGRQIPSSAFEVELCCEDVALYPASTADAATSAAVALARVSTPQVVCTNCAQGKGGTLLQCRSPSATVVNVDRHSWALVALRAAHLVTGTVAAFSDGVGTAEQLEVPAESTSEACRATPAFAPSWLSWAPSVELAVDVLELRCFAPGCDSAPLSALQIAVAQATARYTAAAEPEDGNGRAAAGRLGLEVSCTVSAAYHHHHNADGRTTASLCPLLSDTRVAFHATSAAEEEESGAGEERVDAALSLTGLRATNSSGGTGSGEAVCLRVPAGAALQRVAAALWLLACQRVPRRYAARLTSCAASAHRQDEADAGAVTSTGGRGRGRGGKQKTRWRMQATSPGLLLQCDRPTDDAGAAASASVATASDRAAKSTPLCTVDVGGLHAEMLLHTHGAAWCRKRQEVQLRLGSVRGRTTVMDRPEGAGDRDGGAAPWTFLTLHPEPSSPSTGSPFCSTAVDAAHLAAVSVVQRVDASSTGDINADDNAVEKSSSSDACRRSTPGTGRSTLALHLHHAELQPSLAFLEALTAGILLPCLAGVDAAAAADAATTPATLDSFAHTALCVKASGAVLPRPSELDRHASRMRVVEVVTDWHLREDVRLGGEGGLQLHFRATAGRSVITVRGVKGGSGANTPGVVTLFLAHPLAANGEACPALRVDADVTVRFENVRVVAVASPPGAGLCARLAGSVDSYVELGERALCLLPRDTEPAPAAAAPAAKGDTAKQETAEAHSPPLADAAAQERAVEASMNFSVALTAGARRLAAAGSVDAHYRGAPANATADRAEAGVRRRPAHEGECRIVLRSCDADTGPVTQTPLVARFQLTSGEDGGLPGVRATVDPESTAWRLPVGHVRLLLGTASLARRLFGRVSPAATPAALLWRLTEADGATAVTTGAPHGATALDVTAEVPSATLTLTSDVGCVLVVASVEEARVQCATDTELRDVTVTAEATVLVRDCVSCDDAASPSATAGGRATSRVLLHAKPRLSLAFTRFSTESRSLAVSVSVDEVLATMPLTTTARLLRGATSELGSGCHAFWNSTGVELEVQEASAPATAPRWRLTGARRNELVPTGVRVSSPALRFTPASGEGGAAESVGAVVDMRHSGSDVVARVTLPGYASAFCALDVVVRRARAGHRAALHLTSSVVLANAFFPDRGDATRVVKAGEGETAFTVPPRGARCVPLPVLQSCLAVGLDGCTSTPAARMLTWAMLADAMTLLADEAAAAARGCADGSAARATGRAANLAALLNGGEGGDAEGRVRAPALCHHVRALDSQTLSFPVLLTRKWDTLTSSVATTARTDREGSQAALPLQPAATVSREDGATGAACVVQMTWQWRQSAGPMVAPPFSNRAALCEYTVTVEPVWTLWNWTGCRLRLRLRLRQQEGDGAVLASAEVESGACFQWTPATLAVLVGSVTAAFQLRLPGAAGAAQWWSAATPLSLLERPPPYVRLQQQGGNVTRGAVRIEQAGPSTVVVRCAALLRSALAGAVYLSDATRRRPLLGAGEVGCLLPEQLVPLLYSVYVTTPAPQADRVGFTVATTPLVAAAPPSGTTAASTACETEPFYLTTPVEATALTAEGPADCTRFYVVSAAATAEAAAALASTGCGNGGGHGEVGAGPAEPTASLFAPEPPTVLLLRSLCRIYNADPHRVLHVVPYGAGAPMSSHDAAAELPAVVCIPPGSEVEVTEFGPHAVEPEAQFRYAAHSWSPPVRLLPLATSTQPHVLKHARLPAASDGAGVAEGDEDEQDSFTMSAPARRTSDPTLSLTAPQQQELQRCRCLSVQASTSDACLRVRVALLSVPPLKIVNRLKTPLSFTECPLRATPDSPQPASGTPGAVQTSLCSRAARPGSYVVAAESVGYGCWEVPTLEMQGLRLTLHSNVRRGFTALLDVDLLRAAAAASTGTRVGNTDAYVYVSLDHAKRQYTVTVVPSRQLETRLLFQPRQLTQVEVYMRSCTLYVAAVTLPTAGRLARKSLLAHGARGRLRVHPSHVTSGTAAPIGAATVPPSATLDDVLAVLRQQELDVVLVRVLGVYATATMTERRVFGSASLGLLEVVDCVNVEAAYPVILRIGSSAAGRPGATATPSANTASSSITLGSSGTLPSSCGVPQFTDPSWCSVEVQFTRPEAAASAAQKLVVLVPIQQLRVNVPPVTICADDDFLFTLRTTAARLGEEWWGLSGNALAQGGSAARAVHREDSAPAVAAPVSPPPPPPSSHTAYKVFIYVLRISRVDAVLTYTRTGHHGYNPFDALPMVARHLIPSIENLDLSLKAVRLVNVELPTCGSLASGIAAFAWPLYRTQLLLQSYKVLGSLDVLGNPRALLGSWSRGVWDLVTNASGQSRWAGTQAFLRTTTSSTLHSVGVLARSIGNFAGVSPPERAVASVSSESDSSAVTATIAVGPQRRGVVGEVLREVGGGVSDAVTKPIRGARERGVNGFVAGFAAGMAGLVGRPVFGFFRGISVASEFYARLLGGLAELTEPEARRLGLERNYLLGDARAKATLALPPQPGESVAPAPARPAGTAAPPAGVPTLSSAAYEHCFDDVPHWRRGDETSVRLAVDRVGVHNTALHTPYPSLCSFLAPSEFRSALPSALTAVLATRLLDGLTRTGPGAAAAAQSRATSEKRKSSASEDLVAAGSGAANAEPVDLARQLQRCAHIKVSLGVSALHTYVTDDVFVRACSLAEMEAALTAREQRDMYALLFATALSSAADQLFNP